MGGCFRFRAEVQQSQRPQAGIERNARCYAKGSLRSDGGFDQPETVTADQRRPALSNFTPLLTGPKR